MNLYEKTLFQLARKSVISLKEARALKALFRHEAMETLQLSEESGIDATDIGEVVEGLHRRGLVRRGNGMLKTTPTDCLYKLVETAEKKPQEAAEEIPREAAKDAAKEVRGETDKEKAMALARE